MLSIASCLVDLGT